MKNILRTCRRCKDKEAQVGSTNCKKCDDRNDRHTEKLIAEINENRLRNPTNDIVDDTNEPYGGLGRELDEPGFDYSVLEFH